MRYYQVWHEPNIAPHWGAAPADPAGYLGLLREAAVQLRAADPDARIVLASLAPTTEAGGANLSDLTYLDQLYALGGRAWFDIVAGEPYGFSDSPAAAARPDALNFGRIKLLHEVMVRHGDGETPVWAAAFGWNALPAGWTGPDSPWGQVTAAEQARYTEAALAQARTSWSWLGPLFWPALCPSRTAADPWQGFALCAANGSARPVADALADAAAAPESLAAGRYRPDHPALRYSSGWRVTSAAADPSANGDTLTFDFTGSDLALRIQGGSYWAYYRVTVDGAPANALPRDETGAASSLVLYDPSAVTRWVTVARDLGPGRHVARFEAVGGWGQWALQEIAVTEGAAGRPLPWLLAGLAGLATIALGAWAGVARSQTDHSAKAAGVEALAGFVIRASDRLKPRFQRGVGWMPEWSAWATGLVLAALLVLSRWTIVDFAALAGLGLLFILRPDLSLPLIAASLPFWQQPKRLLGLEFGHFELFLWVAVLALGARWLLARLAGGEWRTANGEGGIANRKSQIANPDWPILALLLSGLASTLIAAEQGVAWREFRIVFLFGAVFYALITRVPWPRGRAFSWRPLVTGLLAGMVAASAVGLWQFVTGEGRIDVEGVWRVRALYGSPNNLALVLDRGAPLALALAAFAFTRRGGEARSEERAEARPEERPEIHLRAMRWRVWAAAGVMLLACVVTFSKGALLLGLPVGLAVVLIGGSWRSGRKWPLWALVGLIVIAAGGLALLFRTPRFADLLNFQSGTSFLRLKLWLGAWHMALDHPILGVGPDNFLYAYRTTYVLPSAWEELNLSHPHNILLDLWTRLGLVGVLAGGWALIAAFRAAWRAFRRGDATTWPLALGLLAGLAATVTHGLIDNSLFLPDLMGLFVIAAGVGRREA